MKCWKRYGFGLLAGVAVLTMAGCISTFHAPTQVPEGMVLIPGGTNEGTNPLTEGESYDDFYPETYSLTVESFYMDKFEVSKALWDEVYNWAVTNGYSFENAGFGNGENHSVHTVDWYDVVKWCNARSEKVGRAAVYTVNGSVYRSGQHDNVVQMSLSGYRLPTETEWEYAARGGLSGLRFPWGGTINHSFANYRANGSAYSYDSSAHTAWTFHPAYNTGRAAFTLPAGSFAANGYGLYDMVGNLWEWTFTASGSGRVLRGGCWGVGANHCRSGASSSRPPGLAYYFFGFRTVLSPGQ